VEDQNERKRCSEEHHRELQKNEAARGFGADWVGTRASEKHSLVELWQCRDCGAVVRVVLS
jgi:hypothetical protein